MRPAEGWRVLGAEHQRLPVQPTPTPPLARPSSPPAAEFNCTPPSGAGLAAADPLPAFLRVLGGGGAAAGALAMLERLDFHCVGAGEYACLEASVAGALGRRRGWDEGAERDACLAAGRAPGQHGATPDRTSLTHPPTHPAGMLVLCRRAKLGPTEMSDAMLLTLMW